MTILDDRSVQPMPDRARVIRTWLPRVAIALVFVSVGRSKFRDPMWVRLFGEIGLGQWFRVFTGVMQIASGVLVLIPRTSLAGMAMAACTMCGASIAWLTVLHAPANALVPATILALLLAVSFGEYYRTR